MNQWLFSVFAKKALISVIKFVVSWLGSGIAATYLQQYGVNVDPAKLQMELTAGGLVVLKFIEDKYELNKANKETPKQ